MARFVYQCPMRWGDMDALGHVNNTAYLTYLEQARVAMFYEQPGSFSGNVVIARQEITYRRPVVYHPMPLRIEMWVAALGGASFELSGVIIDPTRAAENPESAEVVTATTTCVAYDVTRAAPSRLTDSQRALLSSFTDV